MGEQGQVEGVTGEPALIRPIIRLARDEEGKEIEAILLEWGLVPSGLDWSRVRPCWLVAEHQGKIIGVVQVLLGYPLGHIGFWAVDPEYKDLGAGIPLWKAAEKMLGDSGCDGFTGLTDYQPILKRLQKVGGIIFGPPVNWLFKRVYRKPKVEANEVLQKTGT